jgi:hypothetical protein
MPCGLIVVNLVDEGVTMNTDRKYAVQCLVAQGWRGRNLVLGVLLCLLAGAAGAAEVMSAAEAEARVKVTFMEPERFTTTRRDDEPTQRRDAMLAEIGKYVQQTVAPRLAAGQSMEIDVLDLKRAGSLASNAMGATGNMRVIRETDSPRIDLSFRVLDASGAVVRMEQKRSLRDMNFLSHGDRRGSDPLQYEKRLLDDWADRDFPSPRQ